MLSLSPFSTEQSKHVHRNFYNTRTTGRWFNLCMYNNFKVWQGISDEKILNSIRHDTVKSGKVV